MKLLFKFELFRFIFVGIFNTAFSFGIYSMLLFLGMKYYLANLLALVVGILFSFTTQGKFVFGNTETRLLGRFIVCWAVIYVVNIYLIRTMLQLGMNAYTSGAVAIAPITIASYFFQKNFVFRKKG